MSRSLMFCALCSLVACGKGSSDSCDTATADTAQHCPIGGGGTNTGTNPGTGTATGTNITNSAPLSATVTADNGESFTFNAATVIGEWKTGEFGFSGVGSDPTNNFAGGIKSGSGVGTYSFTDGEGDSPTAYTDFRWGLANGGFVGQGGTITITSWDPGTVLGVPGHIASGTFSVPMTNSPDPSDPAPVPITLTFQGSFSGMELVDAN